MSQLTLFESVPQLRPTGDAEFGEDAIQVPTNGAVREKKALADLTVRQPFGGKLRDLQLLGGEAVTGVRRRRPIVSPVTRSSCRARSLH